MTAQAGEDDGKRPLIWAADPNGGVPYLFKDADRKLVGFEVDLKEALSRELGRPIVFKEYDFEKLLDGLSSRNDFDFAMNGLEIVPRHLEKARFTRPYYVYQLQLVVRQGEKRFSNLKEARDNNLTIGSLSGSVADQLLKDQKIKKNSYDEQDAAFQDLKLKRIDGVLMDLPICLYYAALNPPLEKGAEPSVNFRNHAKKTEGLEFAGPPFAKGLYGIAVRKDNEALAKQLDEALDKLLNKGEIKSILVKWDLWNQDQDLLFKTKAEQSKGIDDRKEEEADWKLPVLAASTLGLLASPLGHGPLLSATVVVVRPTEKAATDEEPRRHPAFWTFFKELLKGAKETVIITYQSMLLAVLLALPICLCRMYGPAPLRWLAGAYVEFFRGIPVLFILYFLYFGLPELYPELKEYLIFKAATVAILAFGLNYAAYEAEVYRAAIGAVPAGQWEAAASIGLTPFQTFWRVILPQSVRSILPPMTNDLVSLFKDTSLVAAIAITDLNLSYRNLSRDSGGYLPIVLTTAALYLLMSVPLGYLSRYLEKRWGTK
jgi:polar amino acid transport system substrate-binding protein